MTTSRVGRKPIAIPAGVQVALQGQELHIKGPKGQANVPIHPAVMLQIEEGEIKINPNSKAGYARRGSGSKLNNSISGTMRAKIANYVHGVTEGFQRRLLLVGVGYRAQAKGKELHLTIGFSHPVIFTVPDGIIAETPSLTEIILKGNDKHLLGHVASTIRAIRPPECYKGKGIRYAEEVVILKETKKK